MSTPEVRQSPDGTVLAVRWSAEAKWLVLGVLTRVATVTDDFVSEWTPLLPVSNKDGA